MSAPTLDTAKLRAYIPVEGQEGLRVRDQLLREAADEIDRLREQLRVERFNADMDRQQATSKVY